MHESIFLFHSKIFAEKEGNPLYVMSDLSFVPYTKVTATALSHLVELVES